MTFKTGYDRLFVDDTIAYLTITSEDDKRDGPSTDPCGIPESTSTCDEFTPST
jgi:hypothetical protein